MPTKVNKISLEGFRGATAAIEIPLDTAKPVVLIFGENGTGKSTIADAFDFVCNGGIGSLEDRSPGGQKKSYIPALGQDASNPKVVLFTANGDYTASLARTGPVVTPTTGCPDARILRRSNILKLIDSQPSKRFEELKSFITVPGIEKSENTLRDKHRSVNQALDRAAESYQTAKIALERYWEAEGKSGRDALQWAQAEAEKEVAELESTISSIDTITANFIETDTALSSLNRAVEALSKAKSSQENAQQEQQKVEDEQPKVDAPLLKLLQDAKSFVSE